MTHWVVQLAAICGNFMAFINILEQPLLFIVSLSYLLFSVTISSRALHAPHQETRTSRHSIFKTAIRSS